MSFVLPGDLITDDQGYLRGHGCYIKDGSNDDNDEGVTTELVSALAGSIERISKLITVKSVKSRYIGEVGDLIIGRISSVETKRWKVDINSQKNANLLLSSINLPGGIQRMRTHDDEMQMRILFTESDLISAEIQLISADGSISLHARSLRYGKLENGQYIRVPSGLVKRLPQHYISMPWGVDIILGRNGGIWITRTIPSEWRLVEGLTSDTGGAPPDPEALQRLQLRHASTPLLPGERMNIARTRNTILALSHCSLEISPDSISTLYQESFVREIPTKDMLLKENLAILTASI